jgi:putative protein-disulfide isomerase
MKLYYVVDPMCSWCYGFSPEFDKIAESLSEDIELLYIMGGLAPDSDEPMSESTKQYIRHHWETVASNTGTKFNYDFWSRGEPKRSTYPACRAVIAAGFQGEENKPKMLKAIQKAYYQQARNPSENQTLIEVAAEIGLDQDLFTNDLTSPGVEQLLHEDFRFKNLLGVQGFPTVVLADGDKYFALTIGYTKAEVVLQRLQMVVNGKV